MRVAKRAGMRKRRWRCVDLREAIARRYSVTVHERTVGKLAAPVAADPASAEALSSEEGRRGRGGL